MLKARGDAPLDKLRAAYQTIATSGGLRADTGRERRLAAARSDPSLTLRDREELDLIDAKIDMRLGSTKDTEPLGSAKKKLVEFLRRAVTPEYLSEARGWLAHIHYVSDEQTEAGKIYLDELNRNDSNLSRETLVNSLRMTYGYDGGPKLLADLDKYFDTAEHAAFAIHLVTNPRWDREYRNRNDEHPVVTNSPPYERIKRLLEQNGHLFRSEKGANTLALLAMRTALRAGDPAAALRMAAKVPATAAVRADPDFLWMSASGHFLTRNYARAEQPLLRLFRSWRSSVVQKTAAAYALCGVYYKLQNQAEQIRFALWLNTEVRRNNFYLSNPSMIEDQSVYWASSGWDIGLLLDVEAPVEVLRSFLDKYPSAPGVRLVKYALAVRLAREDQYEDAARIYEELNTPRRAARMRQIASLRGEANRSDVPSDQVLDAKYKMAEFLAANSERIYFNDTLWSGFQRHALFASTDSRLTRTERQKLVVAQRKLKDDQEELWRAYLILLEVVREADTTDLGRRAARLAIRCLRQISDRFEREKEIRAAEIELSSWLRRSGRLPSTAVP